MRPTTNPASAATSATAPSDCHGFSRTYSSVALAAARPLVGDIVICAPVVAREARAQGKPLAAHHAHLLVHGLLHLRGYDHEKGAREARRMEDRERRILAWLGIADPYA